jgi:Transglycosylase-like domain
LRAPLIAVISVGIAAATPAVAVSIETPTNPVPIGTNLQQPIGPVQIQQKPTNAEIRHQKLVRRYLTLRNTANRLIAKRDRRHTPRAVHTTRLVRWSNRGLGRAIRTLRKRIRHVRHDLRAQRAGLTPGVRAVLERIAACESGGNPRSIGGGGAFRGKYQFTYSTWASTGGKGDPAAAPEAEQDLRAALLLRSSGSSPWPVCG